MPHLMWELHVKWRLFTWSRPGDITLINVDGVVWRWGLAPWLRLEMPGLATHGCCCCSMINAFMGFPHKLSNQGAAYTEHDHRVDSRLASSQSLQSNAVSHWLGANLESTMWSGTTNDVNVGTMTTFGSTKSCLNANLVVSIGNRGCLHDNLRCNQWCRSCHQVDNTRRFSMMVFFCLFVSTRNNKLILDEWLQSHAS